MVPSFTSSEDGPVYFWRETETPYGFLSQWYTAPFKAPTSTDDTSPIYFNTTEQYMMYRKAILFCDEEIAHQILQTDVPAKQKSLGRKVKGFNTALWDDHKENIVEEGNWLKFSSEENSSLKNLLLDTKDRELVEASPYDRIWGIGYDAENAGSNRQYWGKNLLGKALERVRGRLHVREEHLLEVGG